MAIDLLYDGDVALRHSVDGGVIDYEGGQPLMDTGGLETASFISLFTSPGYVGNALDAGRPDRQIGSGFEAAAVGVPITSPSLNNIKREAEDSHAWMMSAGVALSVRAVVTAPQRNRVDLVMFITRPDGKVIPFKYALNWDASKLAGAINTGD